MATSSRESAVLFDLDNTLFDHQHSLRSAIRAVRTEYPVLQVREEDELIATYDRCLQNAYNQYLKKEITYEEKDIKKVRLFFGELGMPEPSLEDIENFKQTYQAAYRENRQATSGSVETLIRLRELGYRLAIVTNGQTQDQREKAKAIGVLSLVDFLCTSEEVGAVKPNPRIFRFALDALGADAGLSYMVGDDMRTDIKGALECGLKPILYCPKGGEVKWCASRKDIRVIREMHEILDVLGSKSLRSSKSVEKGKC